MANLTLAVDETTLHRARVRAVQENTSVNTQVREFLVAYADETNLQRQAMDRLVALARGTAAGGGLADRAWTRDDLHEH